MRRRGIWSLWVVLLVCLFCLGGCDGCGNRQSSSQEDSGGEGSSAASEVDLSRAEVYTQWPFDSAEAQRRQQETAERLGVPARRTVDLGNGVTMELVLIPAGEFQMGSPSNESGRDNNERQHRVRISQPFYMAATEVTRAQFDAFVRATNHRTDAEREGNAYGYRDGVWQPIDGLNWRSPGFTQDGSHPVVCVSWNDAQAFCLWLSRRSGLNIHLPTEAQWEYACRAGSSSRFSFGDSDSQLGDYAWHGPYNGGNSNNQTHPVRQKRANAWGLYDMHGNVWEWCSDRYNSDYPSSSVTDPTGPRTGGSRVLRGGGWLNDPRNCRSANRRRLTPEDRCSTYGFRISLDL